MLEISTYTRPFLSCQIWAVPIGAPLMLYMMAFAAETEFCIRWADEQAPQSPTTAAMLNSRDPLGTFIFRLRIEGFAGAAVPRVDRGFGVAVFFFRGRGSGIFFVFEWVVRVGG